MRVGCWSVALTNSLRIGRTRRGTSCGRASSVEPVLHGIAKVHCLRVNSTMICRLKTVFITLIFELVLHTCSSFRNKGNPYEGPGRSWGEVRVGFGDWGELQFEGNKGLGGTGRGDWYARHATRTFVYWKRKSRAASASAHLFCFTLSSNQVKTTNRNARPPSSLSFLSSISHLNFPPFFR